MKDKGQVMAESVLRIPLAELAIFRIVCLRPQCGGVIETLLIH
jgi:hypothetical protein